MGSLSRKFSVLVAALLLGSVVTCCAGIWGLHRVESSLESIVELDVPRLVAITELRKRIRSQIQALAHPRRGDSRLDTGAAPRVRS